MPHQPVRVPPLPPRTGQGQDKEQKAQPEQEPPKDSLAREKPEQQPTQERIIERVFFVPQAQPERRTRNTEPLVLVIPPIQRQEQPERSKLDEKPPTRDRRDEEERKTVDGGAKTTPPEQKELAPPNTNNSVEPTKTIHPENKNNSDGELFEPAKPAPQVDAPDFKKIGKVGRQRRYDELGIDDIEPIKELFLLRYITGKHWPGLSSDMEAYYEKFYFTKPKRGGKDYAKHVKCWERRQRWIAEHTGTGAQEQP